MTPEKPHFDFDHAESLRVTSNDSTIKTPFIDLFLIAAVISALIGVVMYVQLQRTPAPTLHDELGAVIQLPAGYDGQPTKILYWLHGRHGNAYTCPPMWESPTFIIVAPKLDNPDDAMWDEFDLKSLIKRIEDKYPASERYLEGYSRGANGAIHHAAANPGLFRHINALAGTYPQKWRVTDPLTIMAGARDEWWGASSQAYVDVVGGAVVWINSTHNHLEFYGKIPDRTNNPIL